VTKEKAFLISQVLEEAKVDASASGLGLEGFKQLLSESKKTRDEKDSGKKKKKKKKENQGSHSLEIDQRG
jgi:hypothetical protein